MSNATVVKRIVRGSSHRDSVETWDFIVDLLTQGRSGAKRDELLSVAGVASSSYARNTAVNPDRRRHHFDNGSGRVPVPR